LSDTVRLRLISSTDWGDAIRVAAIISALVLTLIPVAQAQQDCATYQRMASAARERFRDDKLKKLSGPSQSADLFSSRIRVPDFPTCIIVLNGDEAMMACYRYLRSESDGRKEYNDLDRALRACFPTFAQGPLIKVPNSRYEEISGARLRH